MSYLEEKNDFIQDDIQENTPMVVTQKWYRSPVVQVAIVTNVLYILKSFGLLESFGITEDSYKEIITALTTIVNVVAYANNPKDKMNW